jgi:hypothetical protein
MVGAFDVGRLVNEPTDVAAQILFESWEEMGRPPHPASAQLRRLINLAVGETLR